MIAPGASVFVDTGAWIALAIVQDSLHERARDQWETLLHAGARFFTSVPVILETFTYLDRKGSRELATRWRSSLSLVPRFTILDCGAADLDPAFRFFDQRQFHKLSLVDVSSFVLMKRRKIRIVFAFDIHFSLAGFRYVG